MTITKTNLEKRDAFMVQLQEAFPECWFRKGEDFCSSGFEGAIWTGEGSFVKDPGFASDLDVRWEAFSMEIYAGFNDGVAPRLHEYLLQNGWGTIEWFDGGTVFIFNEEVAS